MGGNRVGRTARAGRSGRSLTFVTQYDVELLQRIEALTDVKMTSYNTEEEEVLLLQPRVADAQRVATLEMKESGMLGKDDDDSDDGMGGLGNFGSWKKRGKRGGGPSRDGGRGRGKDRNKTRGINKHRRR